MDQVVREARVAGLGRRRMPSLDAIKRRRLELWTVAAVVLLGLLGVLAMLSWEGLEHGPFPPAILRVGVVALGLGFATYIIEKEIHLRRLASLLVDERVLSTAYSNRLHEVSALVAAARAANAVMDLDQVLDVVLDEALGLFGDAEGSVMLLEEPDVLHVVSSRGNEVARGARVRVGDGIAGRVARTLEPLLIQGRADASRFPGLVVRDEGPMSAMSAPLIHRERLVGVLNIGASEERRFREYDLEVLTAFAGYAAMAVANARLQEERTAGAGSETARAGDG